MPIQFACPHCGKSYKVADQLAGKFAPCKACGQRMQVPAAASDEPDLAALAPPDASGEPAPMPMSVDVPEPASPVSPAGGGMKIQMSRKMVTNIIAVGVFAALGAVLLIMRPWESLSGDTGRSGDPEKMGHRAAAADSPEARICQARLARVAKALRQYAEENNDVLPGELGALIGRKVDGTAVSAADFVCAATGRKPPRFGRQATEVAWVNEPDNLDIRYLGADLNLKTDRASQVILYERWNRESDEVIHYLTLDLVVRSEKMPAFRDKLEQ